MINFTKRLFNTYPVLRFLFTGGSNTLFCLLLYTLLLKQNINYLIASSIVNIYGIIQGFLLSSIIVFKFKASIFHLLKYFFVYLISFLCNLLLMYVFVEGLSIAKIIAQILTMATLAFINYQLIKRFVFKVN